MMRNVSPGQPFSMSADEFNSFQQAAQFARAELTRRGARDGIGSATDRTQPLVVSTADEPIRAFSVVKIDGIQEKPSGGPTDDFISLTPLKVAKPTNTEDSFLILQDGLPGIGSAARAVSDGITPAWVNFEEGAEEEKAAGPTSDSFDLTTGGSGVEIVWKPEGTGSLLCVVRFISGGSSCCHNSVMTLIEELPAGGSAKAIPYVTEIPENVTGGVTVCDNIMPNDTTLPIGATIYVSRFADCKLRVIAVSCDALGDGNCGSGYLEDC